MTNTITRRGLLFLFVAVSVLGLSPEKASALILPVFFTPPYYSSDQPVEVWYAPGVLPGGYPTSGYLLYWLDKTPPDLERTLPGFSPLSTATNWPGSFDLLWPSGDNPGCDIYGCYGNPINVGLLSQGTHTIYGFFHIQIFWNISPYNIDYVPYPGYYFSTTINVCVPSYLSSCQSTATNSCGDPSDGVFNCSGRCVYWSEILMNHGLDDGVSVGAPLERYYWNNPYTFSNSCDDSVTRYTDCNGQVDSTPPPNRAGYGSACSTATNSCGEPNAGYMTTCNANGTVSCAIYYTPSVPSYYGTTCALTSLPNACGQTTTVNTAGSYDCNGTCTGTPPAPPSNAACAPTAPTIQGLYQSGVYLGPSAPAYDPLGYQIYANATSPAGYDLTYYFEFSTDGINWSGDPAPAVWATLP